MEFSWVYVATFNVFLLLYPSSHASGIDFTTLMDQIRIIKQEQIIVNCIYNYTHTLESTIDLLKRHLSNYKARVLSPMEEDGRLKSLPSPLRRLDSYQVADIVIKDPLMSLQMLMRFDNDLPLVADSIQNIVSADTILRNEIRSQRESYRFPEENDLTELQSMIANVMILYNITVEDLVEGKLHGIETGIGFDYEHVFEIASVAARNNMFSMAINLLGSILLATDANRDMELRRRADEILQEIIQKHDPMVGADPPPGMLPNPFIFPEKVVQFTEKHKKWGIMQTSPVPKDLALDTTAQIINQAQFDFPAVCRGERNLYQWAHSGLKCFLSSKKHPFWMLAPQKIEVISKDPFIVQIYDILTPAQVTQMKLEKATLLARSQIIDADGKITNDETRVSSTVTMAIDDDSKHWSKLVEMTTGMFATEENEAEALQVTNYAAGGYFVPHMDALFHTEKVKTAIESGDDLRGDRIGTFMFYLSSMEGGGRTGFPTLGIFAEPVEGSALLWHNLYSNTTVDFRTMHGGCPVVYGSKWIATKWIRANAQAINQKCAPQLDAEKEKYWIYDSYGLDH